MWTAPVLHSWSPPDGRPGPYHGHVWRGAGAVRCDTCGRLVIRGQGRWWESLDVATSSV